MPAKTEFITTGAILKCSEGTLPTPMKVTSNTSIKIGGFYAANEKDKVPIVNISPFGICLKLTKSTPIPCVPSPLQWEDTASLKIKGANALMFKSCINCSIGGKIEIVTSGQGPNSPEAIAELQELEKQTQEQLETIKQQDEAVGESGFFEGMIPLWGSGRDLINAVQTGDVIGGILSVGFLAWDVVSIAAGIVTFGGATVVMQGVKGALRGGIKAVLKRGSKAVVKQVAKQVTQGAELAKTIAKHADDLIPFGKKMATGKAKGVAEEVMSSIKQLLPDKPPANMSNAQKGIYGEHVGDIHMHNQGHSKMDGNLTKSTDAPKGKGIDGVWKGANPPPEYIISEAKYGSSKLGKTKDGKQMSDKWIDNRLDKSVGKREADKIRRAKLKGNVEKQLLNIDDKGNVITTILK